METWLPIAGFGGGGVLAAACAYKVLRPRFPVRVNCWFCSADTVVPYGNRNCWDCPSCDQYNGFDKTGDYNKDIPAQHMPELNHGVGCRPEEYLGSSSALCNGCEQNQLLKVKQLASFVPMNEDNYDAEIDAYKDHLERVYELCDPCKVIVEHEVMKQDDALRAKLDANTSDTSNTSQQSHMKGELELPPQAHSTAGDLLGLTSLVCACLVLAFCLAQYPSMLSDVWPLLTFMEIMQPYQQAVHYTGLCLCLMSKILIGKDRLFLVDVGVSVTWILCAAAVTRDITLWFPGLAADKKVLTFLLGVNLVLSLASCVITRRRTTVTTQTFRRLSLDKSTASCPSEAETFAISSVSTSRRAQPDSEPVSEVKEEPLGDLDLEMEAFSLGSKPTQMKRSDSGMFSMTGSQASFTSLSAIPRPLMGPSRPLISPARLRVTSSTPTDIFNQTSSSGPSLHSNPAFDSRSRQSLQFPRLQNQAKDNPFLEQSLTTERLCLFNSQTSATASRHPWQAKRDSDASSTRQFDGSVSEQNTMQASPLRNSSLWQHAQFGQTHLSPDKLSQCRFSSQKPQGSPMQTLQSDVCRGVTRPNTPIRKSLWQHNFLQDLDNQGSVPIENNVFQRTYTRPVVDSAVKSSGSCVLTSSTLMSSLDDDDLLRRRHVQSVEEETSQLKEDSSKSSDCQVDSTVSIKPSKPSNLKMLGLGAVLVVSVLGNAGLVVYLCSKG